MEKIIFALLIALFISSSCKQVEEEIAPKEEERVVNRAEKDESDDDEIDLNKLVLPEGFEVTLYAEGVKNARSMSLSPNGTLFVGTRNAGNVYALQDTNGDKKIDKQYTLLEDGNMPNGVAFKDGDLYVAEVDRILKFSDIESNLDSPGEPTVIFDKFPEEKHHGWKYIAFGPDDKLYVPVGAPCNICKSDDDIFATITKMNADGTNMEIVHEGIRNTVGFDWHPTSGELFFTDNGGDMMGDDLPACELNRANADDMHFGYPYCHQGDTLDKEFGEGKSCDDYTKPFKNLGPHTAPLGCEFYTDTSFPSDYSNAIFIAEHGSWNRTKKIGYRITMVDMDNDMNAGTYSDFISGWLDDETDEVWGRPVDLEWMSDGSMLISDDFADVIYRVSYTGS